MFTNTSIKNLCPESYKENTEH